MLGYFADIGIKADTEEGIFPANEVNKLFSGHGIYDLRFTFSSAELRSNDEYTKKINNFMSK